MRRLLWNSKIWIKYAQWGKIQLDFRRVRFWKLSNISIKIEGDDPTGLGLFPNRKIVIDATDLSGDKTSKELEVNINSSDDLPSLSLGTAGSVTDISVAIENIPLFKSAVTFDDVDTRYDKFSIEMIGGANDEDVLSLKLSTPQNIVESFEKALKSP